MRVTALTIYPIKSCAGVSVRRVDVDGFGPTGDRRFMIVDAAGRFLSQRRHPRLALVEPWIDGEWLRVSAPGAPPLAVRAAPAEGPRVRAEVWGDWCDAIGVDRRADAWFSELLGQAARLVYMPDESHRQADPTYARLGERVSFADGFPWLLASESSLDALNARLERPVAMDRFRPNVVIDGAAPFAEDRWRRVRVGAVPMRVVKPCGRCAVVNVDPATGVAETEPLRTLAAFRTVDGRVVFGQNVVHEGTGVVSVGDAVVAAG